MKFWKFGAKFQKSGLRDGITEFGTIPNFSRHLESLQLPLKYIEISGGRAFFVSSSAPPL